MPCTPLFKVKGSSARRRCSKCVISPTPSSPRPSKGVKPSVKPPGSPKPSSSKGCCCSYHDNQGGGGAPPHPPLDRHLGFTSGLRASDANHLTVPGSQYYSGVESLWVDKHGGYRLSRSVTDLRAEVLATAARAASPGQRPRDLDCRRSSLTDLFPSSGSDRAPGGDTKRYLHKMSLLSGEASDAMDTMFR
jgi:hypothetical protein